MRAREVLAKAEDSPERQEALRLLADRLDLPKETLVGLAPARGTTSATVIEDTRLLDAGDRLERTRSPRALRIRRSSGRSASSRPSTSTPRSAGSFGAPSWRAETIQS